MCLLFIFFACSLSAQTTTNTPPALAPPYGEIPPTFWEQHGTMILAGGAIFLALAALILWKLLQPKPAAIRPPEVVAREALTKLLRQPETGQLVSEVSQILRRYVIATFGLPTAELTTAEFSAALAGNKTIGAEVTQAISGFLHECDERKFSSVDSPKSLNAVNRALAFVKQIQQQKGQLNHDHTSNSRR